MEVELSENTASSTPIRRGAMRAARSRAQRKTTTQQWALMRYVPCLWRIFRTRTAPCFCGRPFPSFPKLCDLSRRGAFGIRPWLSYGSNATEKARRGFMASVSGPEAMQKSACLPPKDTPSGNRQAYINSLSPLWSSTAKSPTKQGRRSLRSWATFPA